MTTIVKELQSNALDSDIPVSDLLRRALVVANSLALTDFEAWLRSELYGYPEPCIELPQYRQLIGRAVALHPTRGWVPFLILDHTLATAASQRGFANSLRELEEIIAQQGDDPMCSVSYAPEAEAILRRLMEYPSALALQIPVAQFWRIVDALRTVVLEWTLRLEREGVLGREGGFTDSERRRAAASAINVETLIAYVWEDRGTHTTVIGGDVVGDKYEAGQVGAMGPHSHAHDITFNQIWNDMRGSFDLSQLAEELGRLRLAMKQEGDDPESDIAVSHVATAELAAKAGDGPKAIGALKSAGKWALDVATKIGVGLAVDAIKRAGS